MILEQCIVIYSVWSYLKSTVSNGNLGQKLTELFVKVELEMFVKVELEISSAL